METPIQTNPQEKILKITFKHDSKIAFPPQATLLDLKTQISKNFLIREDEYELFLGPTSLNKIPNKTTLDVLIEQLKTKDFYIKSYKNIFDLKKQLVDYNEYLDKNIKLKEQEIESFQNHLNNLQNELKSIEEKRNAVEVNPTNKLNENNNELEK
jgi:hypothetical protein